MRYTGTQHRRVTGYHSFLISNTGTPGVKLNEKEFFEYDNPNNIMGYDESRPMGVHASNYPKDK